MNSRTKARLRAVEVLFEADQRQEDIIDVLKRRRLHTAAQISAYAEEIVRGVREHDDEIREYLETYARDWSFERMPAVDRVILRIGAWELLYNDDVPDAVCYLGGNRFGACALYKRFTEILLTVFWISCAR